MHQLSDISVYDIIETDRASGRSRCVTQGAPIEGIYKAEEQARVMERNNRNPNLHYEVQRHMSSRTAEEELAPEALLTHRFRAYRPH